MKILHVALCGPFSDGWNYQENVLSKYHKKMGFDVAILTSTWQLNESGKIINQKPCDYYDQNGIHIYRIKTLFGNVNTKLKKYPNFLHIITKESPDILFVHGCQFVDLKQIVFYAKKHTVDVYVDNHSDFSNSARNFVSRNILHGILWKHYAHLIEPFAKKFYGVLPARSQFLIDVYRLPQKKVDLLLMGGDDELILNSLKTENQDIIRKKLCLSNKDFIMITGGKIDRFKTQTLSLMKAVKYINDCHLKLLIFGVVDDEIMNEFQSLLIDKKIIYIGWVKPEEIYNYFAISNLAIFPGRHSVLWEQSVAQGLPIIIKYWQGTTHLDCQGNALFLYNDSIEEMSKMITFALSPKNYAKLKARAEIIKKNFLYSSIAKKSIERN